MNNKKETCILVADSDSETEKLLKEMFEKSGFNVIIATDGEKALNIINERRDINAVFCDVNLPGKGGKEILLDGKKNNPSLKIVLMAKDGDVDEYLEVMNMGAFEYVVKPFSDQNFQHVYNYLLRTIEPQPHYTFRRSDLRISRSNLKSDFRNVQLQ